MKSLLFILASIISASNTFATSGDIFVGEWVNTDAQGIPRIVISKKGNSWRIQAWGRCSPTPSDWGETGLHLVADSAGGKEYRCCFAKWEKQHADTYFTIKLQGTGSHYYTKVIEGKETEFRADVPQIMIESITVFKDKSKRANYRKLSLLHKKQEVKLEENSSTEKQ